MNLFFKLVTFIFLVSVVQSIESDRNVKSFKVDEKNNKKYVFIHVQLLN